MADSYIGRMGPAPKHLSLAWELVPEGGSGPLQLQVLLGPEHHLEPGAAARIEEARRLASARARGGWRAPDPVAEAATERPTLPWHDSLTPAQHAWVWIKLLRRYAEYPDLTAPKFDRH